jgi:uncharacterized protein YjbI with pentapeptide repeats
MLVEPHDTDGATEATTVTEAALQQTTAQPEPDTSEPSEERKAELRASYLEGSDAPYAGVEIRTLGELTWICTERGWSGEFDLADGMARPNFSKADLSPAIFSGATLIEAKLTEADLSRANLSKADLRGATLSGAFLNYATLEKANLSHANLSKANLSGADLSRASLSEAN